MSVPFDPDIEQAILPFMSCINFAHPYDLADALTANSQTYNKLRADLHEWLRYQHKYDQSKVDDFIQQAWDTLSAGKRSDPMDKALILDARRRLQALSGIYSASNHHRRMAWMILNTNPFERKD